MKFRATIVCASLLLLGIAAVDTGIAASKPSDDLAGYRTVETAITARIQPTTRSSGQPGYLGIAFAPGGGGKLTVGDVNPMSPAALAGFKPGDVIVSAAGQDMRHPDSLQDLLLGRAPGETVEFNILRDGKPLVVSAALAGASRPLKLGSRRVVIGAQLRDVTGGEGAVIDEIFPGMPADRAGLKAGDVIVECDNIPITARQSLTDALFGRDPGETVKMMAKRAGKLEEIHVTLAADTSPQRNDSGRGRRGEADRAAPLFHKDVYRLGLIGIEFQDVKHNPKITTKDWEESFFSRETYNTTNATGQLVYGSVNDYYHEDSAGAFRLEGSIFDWIEAGKKRAEYGFGTGDNAKLLPEVLDKLLAREGKGALDGFDGIAFIYAGERVATTRGGLFWPHKGGMLHDGRRWNYLIVNEGGAKMTNISVFCHEFGHMLGLPDLYARPENPGSEGLGLWCLMSSQLPNGRPQHMSAWCKEQLGWLKPTVIDPTVQQKLVLSPIEGSSRECFKVLVRPDGSEYYLLTNCHKTGFDSDLPGEGLLIWRVVGGRPFLVASHGIEGPAASRSFLYEVPFPSVANNSFTPYTTPSSRSQLGGGLPVFISNIQRHAEGRISFMIGYEYF